MIHRFIIIGRNADFPNIAEFVGGRVAAAPSQPKEKDHDETKPV
jgi:hypothetical protein